MCVMHKEGVLDCVSFHSVNLPKQHATAWNRERTTCQFCVVWDFFANLEQWILEMQLVKG